jgi:putative transcriptional regulator
MSNIELISINLRYYRKNARLTQKELAEKCGTSRKTINQIENKKTDPQINLLGKISETLKIDVIKLIEEI